MDISKGLQGLNLIERIYFYTGLIQKPGNVFIAPPAGCSDWMQEIARAGAEGQERHSSLSPDKASQR